MLLLLYLGLPVLLWDLTHLHSPAKLGQAVMGKCTCSSGGTAVTKEVCEQFALKMALKKETEIVTPPFPYIYKTISLRCSTYMNLDIMHKLLMVSNVAWNF